MRGSLVLLISCLGLGSSLLTAAERDMRPIDVTGVAGDMTCFTFFGQSECLFWTAEGELSDGENEVGEEV
jgi:hypothetical protein